MVRKGSRVQSPSKAHMILIFWILVFIVIFVPFGFGLGFARNGTTISGVHYSSLEYFKTLDYSSFQFFLFGWCLSFVFIVILLLAVLFSKQKFLRYIALLTAIPLQFVCGLSYTMENFQLRTFVVYVKQSWKVNAINIGIISVFATSLIYLLILITLLVIKRKLNVMLFLSSKIFIFISMILFQILTIFIVNHTNILGAFSAVP
jgi:hypothetical protein